MAKVPSLQQAHHRRFPMALVRNTADLIRLLPPLAIVLSLAFLSPKHLRSTYDIDDSRSFPLLPMALVRISALFGRRLRLLSGLYESTRKSTREEKRGFENGTPKFAKIWSPCYAFEVFPGVLSVFRKI
ncbi:hypothetical protein TEA_024946 [Camellia sinensis var. sinensis]|uniref:Uncharacterized protein n=1 Tax=Camellia sinensis var. sinensis TaxID=542762 RepID=A0A4S4DXL2_CAMSN|nr:hypothetical protein TEA_024946 [Camellia sinensis var. sinensis]